MDMLIRAGKLITAAEGEAVRLDQGILLEGGRIKAVANWAEFSPAEGLPVLDASRHTVLPGLVDAHTHVVHSGDPAEDWSLDAVTDLPAMTALRAARQARCHLRMGVTTICDLGARDWVDVALRDAINAGWQPGPRMLVAGHGITATGGHMDPRRGLRPGLPLSALGGLGCVADSADEARRAAREQLMGGADILKINASLSEYVRARGGYCSPELTGEAMRAICEVAHGAGRRVAAHCHGGPGVSAALAAGVDILEHGRFLTDQQLTEMAERGVFLTPTLSPEARMLDAGAWPDNPGDRQWSEKAVAAMYTTVARAYSQGVKVIAGSDAGMPRVPHGGVAYEMYHLARAGLPIQAAIAAATRLAAEALGLEAEIGQVRSGFWADLIVVEGDPTQDLAVLQQRKRILVVIQKGRVAVDRRPGC